jgi:hypothetical protein
MRVPPVSDRIKEAPAQALRGVFAGIGQLLLITDKLRNKTPADQHVPAARVPEPAESVAEAGDVPVARERASVPAEAAGAEATAEAEVTEVPRARKPAERKPARPKPAQPKPAQEKAAAPTAAEPKAEPRPPAPKAPKTPAEKATETRDFNRTGNVRLLPDTGGAAKAASTRAEAEEATRTAEATGSTAPAGPGAAETGSATEAPLANYGELSIASLRARLRNLDIGQVRELAEYEKAHAGRADVIVMFERRIAKLEAGE